MPSSLSRFLVGFVSISIEVLYHIRLKKARIIFESFSPSHKREYLEWITDAKTETTRNKRIAQSVEWISEGKSRNWQYVKKKS